MTNNTTTKQIGSKLIELIKPHEVLYSEMNTMNCTTYQRRELWKQITAEMNQTFNMDWGELSFCDCPSCSFLLIFYNFQFYTEVKHCKYKWWHIRKQYIHIIMRGTSVKKNNIYRDLEFLRSHLKKTSKAIMNKNAFQNSENYEILVQTNTASNQFNQHQQNSYPLVNTKSLFRF